MIGPAPMCYECKHIDLGTMQHCAAFPRGIPARILYSGIEHTKHIRGDNGIKFEPIDDAMRETGEE